MLELADVAQYLQARGALSRQSIVDFGLVVSDVSSRHRNFRVEIPGAGGLQLKQALARDMQPAVLREAILYRQLQESDPRFAGLMPEFRDYDADRGILILALVPDAEDLRVHHLRAKRCRPDVGGAIGEALAMLHSRSAPEGAVTSCPLPPFAGLFEPSVEVFRNASAANLDLLRIIRGADELTSAFDSLRAQLRCESLLHNDLKWDNLLLTPQGMRLVDWESAEYGDPAWDLGSMFGQYLSLWLFSVPLTGSAPVANFAALASFPLGDIKLAINACWTGYFTERQIPAAATSELLRRAISMTAMRLLQTAFESSQFAPQLTSCDILHVQLASNIVQRPVEACRQLLGLPLRADA